MRRASIIAAICVALLFSGVTIAAYQFTGVCSRIGGGPWDDSNCWVDSNGVALSNYGGYEGNGIPGAGSDCNLCEFVVTDSTWSGTTIPQTGSVTLRTTGGGSLALSAAATLNLATATLGGRAGAAGSIALSGAGNFVINLSGPLTVADSNAGDGITKASTGSLILTMTGSGAMTAGANTSLDCLLITGAGVTQVVGGTITGATGNGVVVSVNTTAHIHIKGSVLVGSSSSTSGNAVNVSNTADGNIDNCTFIPGTLASAATNASTGAWTINDSNLYYITGSRGAIGAGPWRFGTLLNTNLIVLGSNKAAKLLDPNWVQTAIAYGDRTGVLEVADSNYVDESAGGTYRRPIPSEVRDGNTYGPLDANVGSHKGGTPSFVPLQVPHDLYWPTMIGGVLILAGTVLRWAKHRRRAT